MKGIGLPEILVIAGMLAAALLAISLFIGALRWTRQKSAQEKVVEKFASAQDLAAFLQTPAGQRFMSELSGGLSSPARSILASIQKGVVIALLGVGFIVADRLFGGPAAAAFGLVLVFLGAGFLLSAGVSYRLAKSWRILDEPEPPAPDRP